MLGSSSYSVEYILSGHDAPVKTTIPSPEFGQILRRMDMCEAKTVGGCMPYGNKDGVLLLPEAGGEVPDGFAPCVFVKSVHERFGVAMTYGARPS